MRRLFEIMFCLIVLLSAASAQTTSPQPIKDPLSDYCKDILYSPEVSEVYIFEGKFTSTGGKSIFITDNTQYSGLGRYFWSAYCPQGSSGLYFKAGDSIWCGLLGPDYLGYVEEFKQYGMLSAGRDGIHFQYLRHGSIQTGFLGGNGGVLIGNHTSKGYEDLTGYDNSTNAYPNYFGDTNRVKVTQYTLPELRAKYGSR